MANRVLETVHISAHVIDAVLTQKFLNANVERLPDLVSGKRLSIAFELGFQRSIEHWRSSSVQTGYVVSFRPSTSSHHERALLTAPDCRPLSSAQSLASTQIVTRNLLDKVDDTSPQLWLLYLHERLGECEPVAGGEEIENVGR